MCPHPPTIIKIYITDDYLLATAKYYLKLPYVKFEEGYRAINVKTKLEIKRIGQILYLKFLGKYFILLSVDLLGQIKILFLTTHINIYIFDVNRSISTI